MTITGEWGGYAGMEKIEKNEMREKRETAELSEFLPSHITLGGAQVWVDAYSRRPNDNRR